MRDDPSSHPALALAGALVLATVFAAFVAAAVLVPDGQRSGTYSSFHFEARIDLFPELEDDILGRVQAWYESPGSWRYEFSSFDPARAHETVMQVSDGEQVWLYRGETNTYTVTSAAEYLANFRPMGGGAPSLPTFSVVLGPVPFGDLDMFLNALTAPGRIEVSRGPGGLVAGRPTERIDMRTPAAQTSSLWVDRDQPFVLRYDAPYDMGGAGRLQGQVTSVTFDDAIDDAIFAFQPPPGAREEPPDNGISMGMGSLGEGVPPPPGFRSPAYVPEGYRAMGFQSSGGGSETTSYTVTYEHQDDSARTLRIAQSLRAGGLAESQRTGEPIEVAGVQGYRQRNGDETVLVWAVGDLTIRVASAGLEVEELLRIAESMRP